MIILLEGADGVGKTTLAKKLCKQYRLDYLHFGIPDEHPMDYWFKDLRKIKGPTVIDRLHLSEEAYGPVYREGSQLSDWDWDFIEGWLLARDSLIVFCSVSWEEMKGNLSKSVGPYHDENQRKVVDNYRLLFDKTNIPLVVYDYLVPEVVREAEMAIAQHIAEYDESLLI